MPPNKHNKRQGESGNVFLFIMLGVALFAALSFTVARGFRSDNSAKMSDRQIDLAASEILDYTARVTRAVDRARRRGCSETELNFHNQIITGLENTSAPVDGSCNIFSSEGGTLTFWDTDAQGIHLDTVQPFYQRQFITGHVMYHPDAGNAANIDLSFWIPDISEDLCQAINKRLNISDIPDSTNKALGGLRFTGVFGTSAAATRDITSVGGELENQMSACTHITTDSSVEIYAFYSILLAR